jgi:hypothetical protein
MKALQIAFLTTVLGLALTASTAMAGTFASTGQTNGTAQFTILNTGGVVTITGSGQDLFTYLVPTAFGATPILANFTLNVSTSSPGGCLTTGCPSGDGFTEQGFIGNFSYIGAAGSAAPGADLLSGTFSVNATPANSGGKLTDTIGGTGGGFGATATGTNLNGIVMTSAYLDFAGVTLQTGSWTFSGGVPAFEVNAADTMPVAGTQFFTENVATFSGLENPTGTPEPATLALLGSALIGLGLVRRKHFMR